MRIGAQFYTLREFCKTTEELAESLKKVADIGYEYVQISGTCGYDAQWLNEQLKKNGLSCVLTHTAPARITDDTVAVAKEHDVLGCKYVGLGHYKVNFAEGETPADFMKKYKNAAQVLKENGKYFMYHNHAHEFMKVDGKTILQHFAEGMDKDIMGFTLDTYWIQKAGADPALWIEKLSGRVPCIHLKDQDYEGKMAVVGEGNINFDRVFTAAQKAGTDFMLVEQDECYGENPFECLKRSYNNLKTMGFK